MICVMLFVLLLMLLVSTALHTGVLQSDTAVTAAGEDSTTDVEEGFIRSLCSASKWVCT
jgi:hypothetical protein